MRPARFFSALFFPGFAILLTTASTAPAGDGNRLADHEVEVKVGSRLDPPFLRTLRLSNDKGRARTKFVVLPDLFPVLGHSITRPDPGAKLYDPSREAQPLATRGTQVP